MIEANIIKFVSTLHVPVVHQLPAAESVLSSFYTISSHVGTVSSFRALKKRHKVRDGLRESYIYIYIYMCVCVCVCVNIKRIYLLTVLFFHLYKLTYTNLRARDLYLWGI
jgi:hypothetical protein